MVLEVQEPSIGIDAQTGGTITGYEHVVQSLRDIFTTGFGERVMREWYGSFVPALLGKNIVPSEVVPTFAAIASAIEQWEPRYRVTQIQITDVTRTGHLSFWIDGEYRPRAVYGDFTPDGTKRITADVNPDGRLQSLRLA